MLRMMALIMISGIAGTGKSTLAKHLANQLSYPIISKDVIKEHLFDSGIKPVILRNWWWFEARSWQIFFDDLKRAIQNDDSVIIEANFFGKYSRVARQLIGGVEKIHELHCTARPGVIYGRYTSRQKSGNRHPGHYDHMWHLNFATELLFVRLGFKLHGRILLPDKSLTIDTTHPDKINYSKILNFVTS